MSIRSDAISEMPRLEKVRAYFRGKASTYDLVEEQAYWRLSDALLVQALERFVVADVPEPFRFIDIGGGTGRWTNHLLSRQRDASGTLIDITPEMIAEAERKLRAQGEIERVDLIVADAEYPHERVSEADYDIAICFHNVLGFSNSPERLVRQAYAALRRDGRFAVFVPNSYHATFFNLYLGRIDEAEQASRGTMGRFTDDMPYIHMFTPRSIRALLKSVGFRVAMITGFPAFIYPGYAETTESANTESISDMLSKPELFDRIMKIEESHIGNDEMAARGNNIFVVGVK